MPAPEIKYAVYPGTITLDSGAEATFTALELATLYGVDDESYLTVSGPTEVPQGETYFEYIHLKPRPDGKYYNIQDSEHTQEDSLIGRDFDGKKKYTQETKRRYNDLDD